MKSDTDYGWASRMLHRAAFRSGGLQVALADVEGQLFGKDLAKVGAGAPAFVTALPRAGTTILLNLLVESGAFVTHTYRDMPFVLCPLLWNRLTGPFQKREEQRERAHGDGLMVSVDSPEAFEEMLWKQFFPGHYLATRITPWERCDDAEFLEFFNNHMQRIRLVRSFGREQFPRYVSKNNLNIARISCLPSALPDARFIVLFREPVQHAASLLKQHEAFLDLHSRDRFTREYMAGVGHFDFGENLRPVSFHNWFDGDLMNASRDISFWLKYWEAVYSYVKAYLGPRVCLLSNEALTARPRESLADVAEFLEMNDSSGLVAQHSRLHAARIHEVNLESVDSALLERTATLYRELCSHSLGAA